MSEYTTEADARIIIDDLLRQAGWDPADKSQVLTEISIRDTSLMVSEEVVKYASKSEQPNLSDDGKLSGRADYVLMDRRGRPLAIIESKALRH